MKIFNRIFYSYFNSLHSFLVASHMNHELQIKTLICKSYESWYQNIHDQSCHNFEIHDSFLFM